MANLTYYYANKVGDYVLGGSIFTPPSTYYLGISTTATQKDGTGITEPSDVAYQRIAITNNKISFSTSSLGVINNLVEFSFPESLASWGIVTDWFLSDSLTGGNIYAHGILTNSRNVEVATILTLPVGAFTTTVE